MAKISTAKANEGMPQYTDTDTVNVNLNQLGECFQKE